MQQKMTEEQFERLFKVESFQGQYKCAGTWNGLDMYEVADTPVKAQLLMKQKLKESRWL